MAVKHSSVAVGTSAADLISGVVDRDGKYDGPSRTVVLTNEGSVTVFIGGSGVTTSAYGYKLVAGAEVSFDLNFDDVLFGIVASGTATVRALHLGV